ncbi:hypothetical protein L1987_32692 [Smallanthus sonchifolius]|uniref:Uncharacterized protein n=1 Tax=Smallanthus sonchifolius TaxID=185202 RepID=A0ACB9HQP0_9ASTR|nr:hypothetical protein L1987_32692 [Smallanthus sonchifolius]
MPQCSGSASGCYRILVKEVVKVKEGIQPWECRSRNRSRKMIDYEECLKIHIQYVQCLPDLRTSFVVLSSIVRLKCFKSKQTLLCIEMNRFQMLFVSRSHPCHLVDAATATDIECQANQASATSEECMVAGE